MKRRTVNDPAVRDILAAFDRMARSPAREGDMLSTFVEGVLDIGSTPRFERWTDVSLRNMLAHWLTRCPIDDLIEARVNAWAEIEWLDGWEMSRRYERLTGKSMPIDVDVAALVKAFNGEDARTVDAPSEASVQ